MLILHKHSTWIKTSQTGGQLYIDAFPYDLSEYSSPELSNWLDQPFPAVYGPNHDTPPACMECLLPVDGSFLCPDCCLPLCGEKCVGGPHHQVQKAERHLPTFYNCGTWIACKADCNQEFIYKTPTLHLYETSRHLMMFCAFNKWYSWVQSALYEIQLYVQSGCNLYNYITAPCLSVTNTTLLYYLDTTLRTLNALVGLWTLTKWNSVTLPHLIQDPIPWAKT